MELVSSEQDIRDNLAAFDRKLKNESNVSGFYHERVREGKNFVSYKVGSEWRFAPSRYIGYKGHSPESYKRYQGHGGMTDNRLSKFLGDRKPNPRKSKLLHKFAKKLGIALKKNDHKFFSSVV